MSLKYLTVRDLRPLWSPSPGERGVPGGFEHRIYPLISNLYVNVYLLLVRLFPLCPRQSCVESVMCYLHFTRDTVNTIYSSVSLIREGVIFRSTYGVISSKNTTTIKGFNRVLTFVSELFFREFNRYFITYVPKAHVHT